MKEKFLKVTKQVVSDMFDDCNAAYFNNEVPRPKKIFMWTPHWKALAMVRPWYNKRTETYGSFLHVSKLYNWTETTLRQVIVHEMIHLYIGDYLRPLRWWERLFPFLIVGHDREFRMVMDDINERFGLGIQVRFKEMRPYYKGRRKK